VKAFITTITLAEVPYLSLLEIRPVVEHTCIWFDHKEPGVESYNLSTWLKNIQQIECGVEYCRKREEVFRAIDQSTRTTLIISCEEGVDFLNELFSGISFNISICGIVIFDKDG
jgi:hypothetical protein